MWVSIARVLIRYAIPIVVSRYVTSVTRARARELAKEPDLNERERARPAAYRIMKK